MTMRSNNPSDFTAAAANRAHLYCRIKEETPEDDFPKANHALRKDVVYEVDMDSQGSDDASQIDICQDPGSLQKTTSQAKYGCTLALGKKRTMADIPSSSTATRSTVNDPSIHMGKVHTDPKDVFAAEMCIGIMRECGRNIPDRNNYWNKVKKCTREQAMSLRPEYINEENWEKLVDYWCEDHSNELCARKQGKPSTVKLSQNTAPTKCDSHFRHMPKDNIDNQSGGDLLERTCTTKKDPTLNLTAKKQINESMIKHTPSEQLDTTAIPDVEIIEEKSSSSTLLSSMGVSSSSKNSSSREHIRELEHIIATQEADARKASVTFHEELNEIIFAQLVEIKELKKKQLQEIEDFKMDQQKKSTDFEKRQRQLEAVLSHLLKKSTQSAQDSE